MSDPAVPEIKLLKAALWPPKQLPTVGVYALLDGARNPEIYPAVKKSERSYRCLYAGQIPAPLIPVAPYLVHLTADHPLTDQVLSEGWEDNWGIIVVSSASMETLRRHFRRFLRVKDETGKTMLFRFYDPRVLRVYLPTCNAVELGAFFEPVQAYLLPSGEPGKGLRFEMHRKDLERKVFNWAPSG